MRNKRILAVVLSGVFLLLFSTQIQEGFPDFTSQVAQIININIGVLKTWQNYGGITHVLSNGSSGKEVALLQSMLAQDRSIYPEKIVSGYYGSLTKSAVIRFQREHLLPLTGIVDAQTRKKINKLFYKELCPRATKIYKDFLLKKVGKGLNTLPSGYIPSNLINISGVVRSAPFTCLRSDVSVHLQEMFYDAEKDGVKLYVTSGFRRASVQGYIFSLWTHIQGIQKTIDSVALPGTSEHQLGSTVDLSDISINNAGVSDTFANSSGGLWMKQNAYRYGFNLSYPKGKKAITGYEYEPWHWRFVGISLATTLHNFHSSYSEYLPESN